jgi:hypothetical protein
MDRLEDGNPAKFAYEAAARFYYELSTITNVTALWKKASDAAWELGNAWLEACRMLMRRWRLRKEV